MVCEYDAPHDGPCLLWKGRGSDPVDHAVIRNVAARLTGAARDEWSAWAADLLDGDN